jgi:hypothetical protein
VMATLGRSPTRMARAERTCRGANLAEDLGRIAVDDSQRGDIEDQAAHASLTGDSRRHGLLENPCMSIAKLRRHADEEARAQLENREVRWRGRRDA